MASELSVQEQIARLAEALVPELKQVRTTADLGSRILGLLNQGRLPTFRSLVATDPEALDAQAAEAIQKALALAITTLESPQDNEAAALFRITEPWSGMSYGKARKAAIELSPVQERRWRDDREPKLLLAVARHIAQQGLNIGIPDRFTHRGEAVAEYLNHYRLLSHITTAVLTRYQQKYTESERRFEALVDGVETWVQVFSDSGGSMTRELEVLKGGRVVRRLENTAAGFQRHEIRFDEHLNRDDTTDLFLRITNSRGGARAKPFHAILVEAPTVYLRVEVHFDPDAPPERVFSIGAPPTTFPMGGSPWQRVPIDEECYAVREYDTCVTGMAYGLIWEWPERMLQ